MYHFIVKQILRRAFANINAARYDRIVPQFAPHHRHIMYGEHALSGERYTMEATAAYARLHRLLPDLRFDALAVAVTGWPWNTTALVSWNDRFHATRRQPG